MEHLTDLQEFTLPYMKKETSLSALKWTLETSDTPKTIHQNIKVDDKHFRQVNLPSSIQ